jgi:mannose-1-phosphate guanylyltransferase
MKALILVGGYGTRLRPLTLSLPKPLVPFFNKPMVKHQIEALVRAGVTEVVLAIQYQPQLMCDALSPLEKELGVKISYSRENEPLGTAGPLALARDVLTEGGECFFVLNSDVTCEFPFEALLAYHKSHKKEGTIMVTRVEEPSKYGVVLYEQPAGVIHNFVEKPQEYVGDRINAGIYIFNPSILDRIVLKPNDVTGTLNEVSIEKEIFPAMCRDKQLYAMDLAGFWMDVGQPKDYLIGMCMLLSSTHKLSPSTLRTGPNFKGNVLVHESVKIGSDCLIGPNVVIGRGVTIGDGCRISRATIMDGCRIGNNSWISNSILGWECNIGRWTRIEGCSVLGKDVTVKDELFLNGAKVLPNKTVSESCANPQVLM